MTLHPIVYKEEYTHMMGEIDNSNWVQAWLDLQCKMIAGISSGLVVLGKSERGPFKKAANWPHGGVISGELSAAAKKALQERRGIFRQQTDGVAEDQPPVAHVACPLIVEGRVIGVVALALNNCADDQRKTAMQLLHWGTAWLEVLVRQQAGATNHRLLDSMELITVCVEQEQFHASATAVATELAHRLNCDRVSIGFLRHGHMEVQVQSHTARVSTKTNLIGDIGLAMDEAVDQGAVINYPLVGSAVPGLIRAHEHLAETAQVRSICTIPMTCRGEVIGALTLERTANQPFDKRAQELCEYLGALLGPILELQRKEDRWLWQKMADSFSAVIRSLFGPRKPGLKLAATAAIALMMFLSFASGEYRVSSRAILEGSVQRAIVVPLDGYVATADVRAGDLVKEGQAMAALEDKDLKLEQLRLSGQQAQLLREHRSALANHDRVQASILSAQLDQTRAQLELIETQLTRTRMVAPFDGVVVSGDLSQALGSPVERGDVLFRVAPLHAYRVVLNVDERDIGQLSVGQNGYLSLSSLPGKVYSLVVEKITPVSTTEDGYNHFRVEAKLQESPEFLRPGMEGIGKIAIGDRKLIWIWSHRMVDWLRLWAWSWWP